MSWLMLVLGLGWLALAVNVLRPIYRPAWLAGLSFAAGWLVGELAIHHVVVQILITGVLVSLGGAEGGAGRLGVGCALLSWIALLVGYARSLTAGAAIDRALRALLGLDFRTRLPLPAVSAHSASPISWRRILKPFPVRRAEIEVIRNVAYAREGNRELRLDIYRRHGHEPGAPTLLWIHGGAWVVGSKDEQGLPLLNRMAARGWVCFSVNYRLSPGATFPDHLIDVKRALAWIREHGPTYGADPSLLVATGGSAGGHLCAMVGLTANDPEYQPGFEETDTSVDACVPFYGVYDFTTPREVWRHGGLHELLQARVMKASLASERERFERASPIHRITPRAPQFLLVHGDADTLVPIEDARRFQAALERIAPGRSALAELPGAQHAFEIFPSLRSEIVLAEIETYLGSLEAGWRAGLDVPWRTGPSQLPVAAS